MTEGGLADIPDGVVGGTSIQIFNAVSLAAGDNLRHGINRTITAQATRLVATALTASLTFHLTDQISKRIYRTLTHLCTRAVTRPLIPMLTQSLSVSVTHAMSRKTQYDYFCHFCLQNEAKLFCNYCYQSFALEQGIDHYAVYFAAYYRFVRGPGAA